MRSSCWSACACASRRKSCAMLRTASEKVIDSMMAVIASARSGLDQGGDRRGAAPRGGEPRAHLRVLPDRRRHQPQPRAVRAALGEGRRALGRFRRQLSRLYRRPRPHGDPGRAGCRAGRSARRDRDDPARRVQADPRRRDGRRDLRGRRGAGREIEAAQQHGIPRARHGPGQPRGAAPDQPRTGALHRRGRAPPARKPAR